MSRLGKELKRLRQHHKLSLRVVQDRTGISNAYISQLETGQAKSPTPPILQKLAGLYETSYEELLALAGYGGAFRPEVRDLFLSHRSTAKPFVRELAADLESESYNGRPLAVWLDEAEIRPGDSIPGLINEGLEKSRFIAIVMTPDYFNSASGYTDAELHAALHTDPDNRRAKIIPLLATDCPYIPYLLRHLRAIDFRGSRYGHGLHELLAVLR